MIFNGQLYNTLEEWNTAESLAHTTCNMLNTYTSERYQLDAISTIDNKFILLELTGFESILMGVGFEFIELDKSIIKSTEI